MFPTIPNSLCFFKSAFEDGECSGRLLIFLSLVFVCRVVYQTNGSFIGGSQSPKSLFKQQPNSESFDEFNDLFHICKHVEKSREMIEVQFFLIYTAKI